MVRSGHARQGRSVRLARMAIDDVRSHPADMRRMFPRGVASARQLMAVGIPERTVYNRCRSGGPWQRPLPGIIVLHNGQPTEEQLLQAALLLAGPGAMLTGLVACRRYGLRRGPRILRETGPCPAHLLIDHGRHRRDAGLVHIERTIRLPTPWLRDGFPLAPPHRACTDALRRLTDAREMVELLADAVQRGLTTIGALSEEIEAGSRRGTADPRQVLRDVRDGVRSAAERDAKRLLTRSTVLPTASWDVEVRDPAGRLLGVADCWFDDVCLDWEMDSTEFHLSPADHDRTVRRAAAFTAAGAVVLPVKPRDVMTDGRTQLRLLEQTYRSAATRPRPRLTARSRRS